MKYLLCFAVGGFYTLSFSPYNITIMSFISVLIFILLLDLENIKDSLIKSFMFSVGFFSVGTYWLENVIKYYTDINYLLSLIIILVFTIYLSLFVIIPVLLSSIVKSNLKLNKNYSLIIMTMLITIFEIVRSFLFTGYSWFNFGQAAISSPLEYFFPVIGVHGLTFIIFLIPIIFINILKSTNLKFFIPVLAVLLLFYSAIYSKEWTFKTHENIKISLIQPNTKNKLIYTNDDILQRMNIMKEMTVKSYKDNINIIVWPEAPLPVPYNDLQTSYYDKLIAAMPNSVFIISGSFYRNKDFVYNSLINISDSKNVYHKKHLVPFGEYLPYRNIISNFYSFLGLSTYDMSPGKISNNIFIDNFYVFSSICYESIFSKESLIKDKNIDFIINVSNDGWFGKSLAPFQHLDALRMRSLENQRYSLRAANTGISAVISPNGDVVSSLQYDKRGVIYSSIEGRNGHTPLSKYGYNTLYIFIFLLFIYSSIYFNINVFKR